MIILIKEAGLTFSKFVFFLKKKTKIKISRSLERVMSSDLEGFSLVITVLTSDNFGHALLPLDTIY